MYKIRTKINKKLKYGNMWDTDPSILALSLRSSIKILGNY